MREGFNQTEETWPEFRFPGSETVVDEKVRAAAEVLSKVGATVGEALHIISEKRFRHLPVIDDDVVHGIVSIGDLTHWLVRNQEEEIQHLVNYIVGNY